MNSVEVRDARFETAVGRALTFEKLVGGCIFTEGPLWHRRERYLLFSDMPGDHLRRWSEKDGVTTFRKPCNKSNGLAWDNEGRLIACEHASRCLPVITATRS
jgi:gluconolactonase